MKLKQFRVRGFRCIHDTDYVSVAEASTLIGKNESGKTAILSALARLNKDHALDEQDICDELVDRLEPEDHIVEGRFQLNDDEQNTMSAALPGISQLTEVVIFRTRASKEAVYDFPGAKFPKKFACNESAKPAFVAALEQLAAVMPAAINSAFATPEQTEQQGAASDGDVEEAEVSVSPGPNFRQDVVLKQWDAAIKAILAAQPFEFKTTDPQFRKLADIAAPYIKGVKSAASALDVAKKALKTLFIQDDYQAKVAQVFAEKLHPKLLYFPDYKVIDGIIDIASYLQSSEVTPKRSDTGYQFEKAETVRNLFHLAQLDPKQLEILAKAPSRLTSELNRCSARLTHMLALTWKSKKIDVRLHYTNGTVTVEVGDIYLDGTTKNRGLLGKR